MTSLLESPAALRRVTPRRTTVGLVAGGLGAYWPQFPDLLPQLQRSAARVSERLRQVGDIDVVDVGFISDAPEGAVAAEKRQPSAANAFGNSRTIVECTHGAWDAYGLRCDAGE